MKDTEAARRALEVAVQQLGTNPALVERAERDRDQSQEAATFFLEMAAPTDAKKRDLLVRAAREGREGAVKWLLAAGVDPDAVGSEALEEIGQCGCTALIACSCAPCARPRSDLPLAEHRPHDSAFLCSLLEARTNQSRSPRLRSECAAIQ